MKVQKRGDYLFIDLRSLKERHPTTVVSTHTGNKVDLEQLLYVQIDRINSLQYILEQLSTKITDALEKKCECEQKPKKKGWFKR